MEINEIYKNLQEASVASGLDRQSVRKWASRPTKGKIACSLVRGGVITFDQYELLNDSSIKFYNNLLLAFLNIKFALTIDDISELMSVTRKTVTTLADGKASDTTRKALFYVCVNKLGIENPEELFYAPSDQTD